jgi:anaerobic magnesium-protoporphyrin IX monomethyl ester cyclase
MKILFTHSYFLEFDAKQKKQSKPYPPLGTLYAMSYLKQHGYEVSIWDANFAKDPKEILPLLKREKADALVIYDDGFNYLTKMCLTNMREAAFDILKMAKERNMYTVVSSSDSTDHFAQYLQEGADEVILGEAEETLLELMNQLKANGNTSKETAGIATMFDGKAIKTAPRAVKKTLDELPYPAWDLLDIKPYQQAWKRHGYFSINVATTRGCPFKCNWCAKPIYGNRYNSHSPDYISGLIAHMKSLFHFDHIWFCDDIFGLKPNWVQAFQKSMEKEELYIPFKIQSRADLLVKEDTVEALAEAGCDEVWIGAESGSQKVLDAMDKGTTIEQIEEATSMMKKHKIKPCFFLQFGYPGEEWEDIKATLNLLARLKPSDIGISVSYPLPGTSFYEKVKKELNAKMNWTDSDELLLMYKGTYSSTFYKVLHRMVHRMFRADQAKALMASKASSILTKCYNITRWSYHKSLQFLGGIQLKQLKKRETSHV